MLSPQAPDFWQAFTHSKGIMRLTYSRDGKHLYTVGRNETIYQIPVLGAKSNDWKSVSTGEAPVVGNNGAGPRNGDDDDFESEDEMDIDGKNENLIMGLAASVSIDEFVDCHYY